MRLGLKTTEEACKNVARTDVCRRGIRYEVSDDKTSHILQDSDHIFVPGQPYSRGVESTE